MDSQEKHQYYDEIERHFASIRTLAQRLDFSEESRVKLLQAASAILEERNRSYSTAGISAGHVSKGPTDAQREREAREMAEQRRNREELDRRTKMAEDANRGAGKHI